MTNNPIKPDESRDFTDVADRFDRAIYQKPKGQLRLNLLWRDLCEQVLNFNASDHDNSRVLDVGGGLGHMAALLADFGCAVTLREPSPVMVKGARELFEGRGLNIDIQPIPLAAREDEALFDGIVCHAVLEWVPDGPAFFERLVSWLKPGGWLSLAYYNRNGVIMRNMVRGNLIKVASGQFAGDPGSLTPTHPVDPDHVLEWGRSLGLNHSSRRGVRVFNDYMPTAHQHRLPFADIEALEWQYGGLPAWRDLGRYVHDVFFKGAEVKT